MDFPSNYAPDLKIVNFTTASAAVALSRDIECLGYRHRVESGHSWLQKNASKTPGSAHVLLVGSDRHFRQGTNALVSKLAARPWICVLTGRNQTVAEGLMRASTEFLQSPWSREELAIRLERFTAQLGISGEEKTAPEDSDLAGLEIIGSAPEFHRTLTAARRAAACAAPAIIEGETGTGKELIARLVHRLSDRSRRPFVPVNCGCLPTDLVENELFGHEAGAYTGAGAARNGVVQQAERGTLFLDEVDTLLPRAQIALLRFMQQGEVRPVGGGQVRQVDVRVLAAANRPLEALVAAGSFREDLYFRLNVLQLNLPPLRERRSDVISLAQHFLIRHAAAYNLPGLILSQAAQDWITGHDWPGNVRQLENLIHRAVLTADGHRIELSDIAPSGSEEPDRPIHKPALADTFAAAKARAVDAFEQHYLISLMSEAGGNVTLAAARAGKERRALGRLLKKHGIEGGQFR